MAATLSFLKYRERDDNVSLTLDYIENQLSKVVADLALAPKDRPGHISYVRDRRRRKPVVFDLTGEMEDALKSWTCPECRKTYSPPLTIYISPIDGRERCGDCSSRKG
jgi:hypothetical protein